MGRAPSFWLPLAGYARQHPERQEWRAVPALDNKMIYVDFVEEGMAEGFDWTDTILNNILFNLTEHILVRSPRLAIDSFLPGCGR